MSDFSLLQQAKTAAGQSRDEEARRLLIAALEQDPTNDQVLLWLVYLAEDDQASLTYLGQLLDAHPHHPQARTAIRRVRRRIPVSHPPTTQLTRKRQPSGPLWSQRILIYGLALLALLAGIEMLWQINQPSSASPPQAPDQSPTLPASSPAFFQTLKVSIPLFTPTPVATAIPRATATSPPSSAWVPVLGQPQSRNLSCESRSVADLAAYWGVSVNELDFLAALGQSDNPHKGFVGDVDEPPGSLPPYGYGVYAEPVAATMREYGLDARAVYDLGLDGIQSELLAGRPVMVWATYGMVPHDPLEWTSNDGQHSTVVPFMHTFLVTGFDEAELFVLDAYDSTVQRYPTEVFLQTWNLFDQMAVVVTGPFQGDSHP